MKHIDKTFLLLIATGAIIAIALYIPILFAIKREPHRTTCTLLKAGLALLVLDGISIVAFMRLSRQQPPGIGALWSGWAVLLFSAGSVMCFGFSLLFWADKRWNVISKLEFPRRRHY